MSAEDDIDALTSPSKSQIKREMLALQDLGIKLTELDQPTLARCALPAKLQAAIEEYRRLPNKHGAKKRQMQFIGKLLRDIDVSALENILQEKKQNVELEKQRFHQLELLRDRLLAGSDEELSALISKYPELDIQHLRQLIRQAQKEARENKAPAASRKLFKYLRELSRP